LTARKGVHIFLNDFDGELKLCSSKETCDLIVSLFVLLGWKLEGRNSSASQVVAATFNASM